MPLPEPVPPPQIHPQLLSRSPQGCNVTLRCSLPPTSPAWTSWQLGNTSGTLWEQSGDGQTLWLAIPPGALNATYTCVARSPAEERSSSVSLSALCQLGKAPHIPPTVILGWWWGRPATHRPPICPRRGRQAEVGHLHGGAGCRRGAAERPVLPEEEEEEGGGRRWAPRRGPQHGCDVPRALGGSPRPPLALPSSSSPLQPPAWRRSRSTHRSRGEAPPRRTRR